VASGGFEGDISSLGFANSVVRKSELLSGYAHADTALQHDGFTKDLAEYTEHQEVSVTTSYSYYSSTV
jgi:hypothetical protein